MGFFMADPKLQVAGRPLPLQALYCQTVLSRCVGRVDEWVDALRLPAACKYNMVHFTPVQELGESGSCYSIAQQTSLAQSLFPQPVLEEVAAAPSVDAGEVCVWYCGLLCCLLTQCLVLVAGACAGARRLSWSTWRLRSLIWSASGCSGCRDTL